MNNRMMKKIFVICLHTALFTMTYCVMSKYVTKNMTPDDLYDKAMRKGSDDGGNPRYTQTEMPPGQYCLCSKIYDPVCASNNESYFNLCYLECKVPIGENVSVIHQGNCIPY